MRARTKLEVLLDNYVNDLFAHVRHNRISLISSELVSTPLEKARFLLDYRGIRIEPNLNILSRNKRVIFVHWNSSHCFV